ncbi:MAG: SufE family protein, partial [Tabrizicola sp.]
LGRLGLNEHLSSQRSNGVRAMVQRIREEAASRA